jgi:1-phosphatidylinositol-4-phosphate 5-kinase
MYQRDEFNRICDLLDITPEDILNSLDLQEN